MGSDKDWIGIYEDDVGGIYYGHQSEFSNEMRFMVGVNDFLLAKGFESGTLELAMSKVKQSYARWCVADCGWHELGGFWHIEHEPGRGRTKIWQYGE